MSLLGFMQPETYAMKVVSLIVGCLILGFGVFMEMVANVAMLPGEATVRAVSDVFSTDFGKTKIAFDSSMTVIAAILSFIMFRHLDGVREGTIVPAILVGFIARLFKKIYRRNRKNTYFLILVLTLEDIYGIIIG